MKKTIFVFVVDVFCITSIFAQSLGSSCSGEKWKSFGRYLEAKKMRIALLEGIFEGAWAINHEKAKEIYSFSSDYETLVARVTQFYDDKDNMKIPLTHALYIIALEKKGRSKATVESELKKMRQGIVPEFLKKDKESKAQTIDIKEKPSESATP